MGTKSDNRVKKMHPDEVRNFVRTHKEPCVTANMVAEKFDCTNKAARYRLEQLEDGGGLRSKKVGAKAKVWYAECRMNTEQKQRPTD